MEFQHSLTSEFRQRQIDQGLRGITSYLNTDSQEIVDERHQLLVNLMKHAEQKAYDTSKTLAEYSSTLSREIRRIVKHGYSDESLESLLAKYEKQGVSVDKDVPRDHDCFECIRKAMNLPSIEKYHS